MNDVRILAILQIFTTYELQTNVLPITINYFKDSLIRLLKFINYSHSKLHRFNH